MELLLRTKVERWRGRPPRGLDVDIANESTGPADAKLVFLESNRDTIEDAIADVRPMTRCLLGGQVSLSDILLGFLPSIWGDIWRKWASITSGACSELPSRRYLCIDMHPSIA